ncbi:MAG: hypothetical protein M1838_002963 [Thelocarpon superellum]|nr:MAG: hypothetical protein M1838_002963 [Thelocarpon superellum]
MSLTYFISLHLRESGGSGKHIWNVRLVDLAPAFLKWYLAVAMVYTAVLRSAKIAIQLLYLCLFETDRKFLWIVFLTIIFGCTPFWRAWEPQVPGLCVDTYAISVFTAAMNVIADINILIVPMPIVWRANLEKKTRIGPKLIFLMGAFICVVSVARLAATSLSYKETDITYNVVRWDICSLFEGNVGIEVGCLPVTQPL